MTQSERGTPVVHAIVDITDSSRNSIFTTETDSSGLFTASIDTTQYFWLHVSHQAGCDFHFLPYNVKLKKQEALDTLEIMLRIVYDDYRSPFLLAKEYTLLFSDGYDSIPYCPLSSSDTTCTVFHELKLLYLICNCDPAVSSLEVDSYYTKREKKKSGDSLAVARAQAIISYMNTLGMPSDVFVVKTRYLEKYPLRHADGTYYKDHPVVQFRILAYKSS